MKKLIGIALGILLVAAVGCSKSSDGAVASGSSTIVQSNTVPLAEQLNAAPSNQPTMSPPAEIVAQFLDSLRRGDEVLTAQLMTTAARAEVARHNLAVSPPGSPQASFQIGETREIEAGRALVESVWTEPSNGTDPVMRTEVLFDVRLEQHGWRLAGMVIDMGAEQEPIIVDFENLSGLLDPENQVDTSRMANTANENDTNVDAESGLRGDSGTNPKLASPLSSEGSGLRR